MPTRTPAIGCLACAYASHGDTKHVLLFPEDPKEGFEMAADSFDLADRLQTPVFVLYDLDIGMNERLCEPLVWDDSKRFDRGKVLSYQDLEAGKRFGATSTSTATASPIAPTPARIPSAARSSRAARRATAMRATRRRAARTSTTCSGC
jgi:2-oxoglutarate ferredoxin oxidoreductase subunit alpha